MSKRSRSPSPSNPSRRKLLGAGAASALAATLVSGSAPAAPAPGAGKKHRMLASSLIHTGQHEAFTGQTWGNWPFEYRMRQVAEAGFTGVGLLHPDLDHVFRFEAKGGTLADRIRWMKAVLDDNGLVDVEIEFLTNWMFPRGDLRREAEQPVCDMLREMAKIMRPHHLKCGNFAQPEPIEQVRAGFRELCEDFSDTVVAYEVLTNEPYGGDINQMVHIVEGNDNGGLFFDTWHTRVC